MLKDFMSRFTQLLSSAASVFGYEFNHFLIDWGGLYTRIMLNDELIYNQPSCFLRDTSSGSVINIGQEVLNLRDKQPPGTEIVFPVKQGSIHNKTDAVDFLQAIFKQQQVGPSLPLLGRGNVTYSCPALATNLDREVYQEVFEEVGLSQANCVTKSKAILANLSQERSELFKQFNMVTIDFGHELTELGVFVNGTVIKTQSLRFGSKRITQMIQRVVREKYGLNIGWHSAERLKFQLPNLLQSEVETVADDRTNLRGVDLVDNLIITKTVRFGDFAPGLKTIMLNLVKEVKFGFSQVDPGLIVAALENGVYLSGGGTLLTGLDDFLSSHLQTPVYRSKQPYLDVIKGLDRELSSMSA
jgi:rod shape-determining protein MreB